MDDTIWENQKVAALERRVLMLEKAWLELYQTVRYVQYKGEIRNLDEVDFFDAILEKEVRSHGSSRSN